jgi:signal transduction histidine kinase
MDHYTETMLLRNVSEQDRQTFLTRTLSEAERLQRLIDTVLISARLQSNKASSNLGRVDLKEILLASYNKAKERFSESRHFELNFQDINEEGSLFLLGNSYHLSTLFDNLLDNAVKYTKKEGRIKVETLLKKDLIIIAIKDDGCGIEKDNLKKIFKKFYRVDNQAQTIIKGSGLGLSVCYSIVKEHSANIYAQSEGLNKGSTFYVEFKGISSHH